MRLPLALLLILSSCGLPEIEDRLYPPSYISTSQTELIFRHDVENTAVSFAGYEIYYRLYEKSADARSDASYIESGLDDANDSTAASVFLQRILSKRYKRVVDVENAASGATTSDILSDKPLVAISSTMLSSSVEASINFYGEGASSIFVNGARSSTLSIRRSALDSKGSFKTFADLSRDSDDDDCFYASTTTDPDQVYLKVYVLAYGSNVAAASLTDVYSKPARPPNGDLIVLTK